jgi:hypothetical protein
LLLLTQSLLSSPPFYLTFPFVLLFLLSFPATSPVHIFLLLPLLLIFFFFFFCYSLPSTLPFFPSAFWPAHFRIQCPKRTEA